MLYAASIKISFGKNQRRIDLIIDAEDPKNVEEKAIKQAKKIYCPNKKATYTLLTMVSESEALESISQPEASESETLLNQEE